MLVGLKRDCLSYSCCTTFQVRLRCACAGTLAAWAGRSSGRARRGSQVLDFMIGLAFVAMVLTPAIVASSSHSDSSEDGD
jgi:hypothetical protein